MALPLSRCRASLRLSTYTLSLIPLRARQFLPRSFSQSSIAYSKTQPTKDDVLNLWDQCTTTSMPAMVGANVRQIAMRVYRQLPVSMDSTRGS